MNKSNKNNNLSRLINPHILIYYAYLGNHRETLWRQMLIGMSLHKCRHIFTLYTHTHT